MATKPRVNVVGGYFMGEDVSLFDAGVFNLASSVASVKDISKSKIKKLGKSVFLAEFHRAWTLNADCFLRQCTKQPKMVRHQTTAMTSDSSGEISAVYAVGLLSFREALGVAYYRGELARKGLSEKYIADPTNDGHIVVACINSPKSVTFSRNLEALDELAAKLEEDGIFARKLKVSMAYHSRHTAPMAQEYADRLHAILTPSPIFNCRSINRIKI
ncbi:uncharacterized protein MCYG_05490 [Microsporum canis CBS 113480]|uniref:Malonyl-CoA:ACP transacylase (MAT) domain-containing protein n=1 Tax=Arthroderma otae (strain ATCC MYA-4605 / CBS 113480) TaxID=554155 RepID=C5FS18_ARTOC|nr:uncharacterized protein MCYG_05490 [Microsporum canis CBS 113480]EEQ32671.1 predicted protein [Microsporum canis CBS 113480]